MDISYERVSLKMVESSCPMMDKELLEIIPQRERKKGRRFADLLAKVYLKDGAERWILAHTEIEGGRLTAPHLHAIYPLGIADST